MCGLNGEWNIVFVFSAMLDSAVTVQEASDRPTVKRARGCRGRLAKRRSREKWLAKIGAEFVSNSHQKKVVDKRSTKAAVEAAVEQVGSSEGFGWGCTSWWRCASSHVAPFVGGKGAATSQWGTRAHSCCMVAGIVIVLVLVPIWAREVAACGVVACCVASWATQKNEDEKEEELHMAAAKKSQVTRKGMVGLKLIFELRGLPADFDGKYLK